MDFLTHHTDATADFKATRMLDKSLIVIAINEEHRPWLRCILDRFILAKLGKILGGFNVGTIVIVHIKNPIGKQRKIPLPFIKGHRIERDFGNALFDKEPKRRVMLCVNAAVYRKEQLLMLVGT